MEDTFNPSSISLSLGANFPLLDSLNDASAAKAAKTTKKESTQPTTDLGGGAVEVIAGFEQMMVAMFKVFSDIITKLLSVVDDLASKAAAKGSTATTGSKPSDTTDSTGDAAGSNEFLWKPISEKDKKLAIVLPSDLTGEVASVTLEDSKNKPLASGKYSGVGNGNRETYRFGAKGSTYPDGLHVKITMKNGEEKSVKITDTAKRVTKKKI